MQYAMLTEAGCRKQNQDSVYIPAAADDIPLIIVADGMGGHNAGELASGMAVSSITKYCKNATDESFEERIANAADYANTEIYSLSDKSETYRGMGTTVVCALLSADKFIAANVGDSRIYHLSKKGLVLVSHDHSIIGELLYKGEITSEEARTHPYRNVITRALGTDANEMVDVFECDWENGDMLMLCTDGLHGFVSHNIMEELLSGDACLDDICRQLLNKALECGSTDNITIALAKNVGIDA